MKIREDNRNLRKKLVKIAGLLLGRRVFGVRAVRRAAARRRESHGAGCGDARELFSDNGPGGECAIY